MKLIRYILMCFVSFVSSASALEVGGVYRLNSITSVYDDYLKAKNRSESDRIALGKSSRFRVEQDLGGVYRISLINIYKIPCYVPIEHDSRELKPQACESDKKKIIKAVGGGIATHRHELTDTYAVVGGVYYLPMTVESSSETKISIDKLTKKSETGPVVGALLVPYKYRTDTKTIDGETTIAVYMGYAIEPEWFNRRVDTSVTFVPYLSAGLTSIDVNNVSDSGEIQADSKQGVTLAFGFILKNWDSTNLGFVIGQDRIGDESWEHEGKTWLSFSVGWNIN